MLIIIPGTYGEATTYIRGFNLKKSECFVALDVRWYRAALKKFGELTEVVFVGNASKNSAYEEAMRDKMIRANPHLDSDVGLDVDGKIKVTKGRVSDLITRPGQRLGGIFS